MEYSEGVWEHLSKMDPLWQRQQYLTPDFWEKSEQAFNEYRAQLIEQNRKNAKAVEWWKTQRGGE